MAQLSYLRHGKFFDSTIVFVTDDDLWTTTYDFETQQVLGQARRLTTGNGMIRSSSISPDGTTLYFESNETSEFDVYSMSIDGGPQERKTFVGDARVKGFWNEETIAYSTSANQPLPQMEQLCLLNDRTGELQELSVGPISEFANSDGVTVVARNSWELGRWKGYRGGLAGTFWIKRKNSKTYKQILQDLDSNLSSPRIVGKRLYFLSDHLGSANVFSCDFFGRRIEQHTFFEGVYVRQLEGNANPESDIPFTLMFQWEGDLYFLNPDSNDTIKIAMQVASQWKDSQPRYVAASKYLQDFDLGNAGDKVGIVSRGQAHILTPWYGAPEKINVQDSERIRFIAFGKEKHLFIVSVNSQGEDVILDYDMEKRKSVAVMTSERGKITHLMSSPDGRFLAYTNERYELWVYDSQSKKDKFVMRAGHESIRDLDWSPDSQWLAFSAAFYGKFKIFLVNVKTFKPRELFPQGTSDFSPSFSKDGRYLFFIGVRELDPRMDETYLQISFPDVTKPYCLRLAKHEISLFDLPLMREEALDEFEGDDQDDEDDEVAEPKSDAKKKKAVAKGKKTAKKQVKKTTKSVQSAGKKKQNKSVSVKMIIDFDQIEQRVEAFPVDQGGFESIVSADGRVLWTREGESGETCSEVHAEIQSYCYANGEIENLSDASDSFALNAKGDMILLREHDDLRLIPIDIKPTEGHAYNRKDGWINVDKVCLHVDPRFEWMQMYKEAWVLQREHFWQPNMKGWVEVFERYYPLLSRIHTRSEFSDLIWEMQGELKTSHCYEYMGDFIRRGSFNQVGRLGADFRWLKRRKVFQITELYSGESWSQGAANPLTAKGVELEVGDFLVAIDGQEFGNPQDLHRALEFKADREILIKVQRRGSKGFGFVSVKPKLDERQIRYKAWVEDNRQKVLAATDGRVGYVHIPNMGADGYAEFWAQFLKSFECEGLVVDVRYNSGGYVSELVLQSIMQKSLGTFKGRWDEKGLKYPMLGRSGPLVAIANEHTASDGDIFSHAFKLSSLGPLVGKRTWGGVVGIMPRVGLIDGTITTQPEYATWFNDVEYGLENYGTSPDIEVDITLEDWVANKDTQLEAAIKYARSNLSALGKSKKKKAGSKKPRLPK